MIARLLNSNERNSYDRVVKHPLQSWAWGDFKAATGHTVERLGFFEGKKLVSGVQVIFNRLPGFNYTVGYVPRGIMPDQDQLESLKSLANKHNAIYIKLEPNVATKQGSQNSAYEQVITFLKKNGAVRGKALFTKYTFWIDLTPPIDKLFASLSNKSRYNTRLATKKGVTIIENTTKEGMEQYIRLMEETTKRQQFLNHNGDYFRTLHKTLGENGMMKIFHAVYEDQVLTSWVTFNFNDRFYYPYGASSNKNREAMPNNLMMWEMIRYAKSQDCQVFDLWGSLGPEPDKGNPWYGFHRFKEGYGGDLEEYIGTFDLVYEPQLYKLFNFADKWRWKLLKFKSQFTK